MQLIGWLWLLSLSVIASARIEKTVSIVAVSRSSFIQLSFHSHLAMATFGCAFSNSPFLIAVPQFALSCAKCSAHLYALSHVLLSGDLPIAAAASCS